MSLLHKSIGGRRFRLIEVGNATSFVERFVLIQTPIEAIDLHTLVNRFTEAGTNPHLHKIISRFKKAHRAQCLDPPLCTSPGAATRPCTARATTVEPVIPVHAGGVPAAGFGLPVMLPLDPLALGQIYTSRRCSCWIHAHAVVGGWIRSVVARSMPPLPPVAGSAANGWLEAASAL